MRGAILSLIITAGLGFTSPAFAQSEPIKLTERQAKRLSGKLCRTLSKYAQNQLDGNIGDDFETYLLEFSGLDKSSISYKKQLADFWNKNSAEFICKANGNSTYPEQHLLHRVVRQGFTTLVLKDYLFSTPEVFPIDPNVVSINQYGQTETIIDYIDRLLLVPNAEEDFNTGHIREVRDIIENDFGGKRARELQ